MIRFHAIHPGALPDNELFKVADVFRHNQAIVDINIMETRGRTKAITTRTDNEEGEEREEITQTGYTARSNR